MNNLLEAIAGDMTNISDENDLHWDIYHYKVPGGWIVYRDLTIYPKKGDKVLHINSTSNFVADPDHKWNIE